MAKLLILQQWYGSQILYEAHLTSTPNVRSSIAVRAFKILEALNEETKQNLDYSVIKG